ncbi:MAG: glutamate-5-semialdehyde dehydrogenase [Thermoflexales bacterium]
MEMIEIGRRAKAASRQLARAGAAQKDAALRAIADGLTACQDDILRANAQDVQNAKARNVEAYFIDRLTLTPQRLRAMADDVRAVAALPDPIGEQFDHRTLPNGLRLHKRRVPLGVLGVIYEARPNVTTDVAALALKSGNAVILRGGSDNIHSNTALTAVIHAALDRAGLPADAVQLIADADRARILELLRLNDYVDLIIPRGGEGLHRFCREHSAIPVITGGMGINHLYVDETADQAKAVEVVFNAKTSKPTVCNALGTLLVQATIAAAFLPKVAARLAEKGVELRCDERAFAILQPQSPLARRADDATDWDTEWLALILGVKVVDSLDEAIAFIRAHTMEHSDGICSRDPQAIERFVSEIDSSAVFVNASTRFNDGGQFGLGAEVAISTQRIHARGPMGLRELTSYKWVCEGDGHVRP